LIVVDASALVAIGRPEIDREIFEEAILAADVAYLSAVNYVEAAIVLIGHGFVRTTGEMDAWLAELTVTVKEDEALAGMAAATYLRYGKGFHPARLNLADCFAYALAKTLDAPLLFKGGDFSQTDIRSAL
jgi:ribonuclease VapC